MAHHKSHALCVVCVCCVRMDVLLWPAYCLSTSSLFVTAIKYSGQCLVYICCDTLPLILTSHLTTALTEVSKQWRIALWVE